MAQGECAGEMVTQVEFGFAAAETAAFEAQLALERNDYAKADEFAYRAMLEAATTILRTELLDVPQNPDLIVNEFRTRFVDTKLFVDKYMGNTFSNYLLRGMKIRRRGSTRTTPGGSPTRRVSLSTRLTPATQKFRRAPR